MISILEELGNSSVEDEVFDVDQFTEMMEAYLPGFQDFNRFSKSIIQHYNIFNESFLGDLLHKISCGYIYQKLVITFYNIIDLGGYGY